MERAIQRTIDFFSDRPRLTRGVLAGLVIMILVNSFRIVEERKAVVLFGPQSSSDFDDYFNAAKLIKEGKDPYHTTGLKNLIIEFKDQKVPSFDWKSIAEIAQKLKGIGTYLYLPLTAFLLVPLAGLPYPVATGIFQVTSFAALVGFFGFLYRNYSSQKFLVYLLLSILVMYRYLLENAMNGNIGFFLILLCGVGLVFADRDEWHYQILGGLLIGIAVVLKVTPAFLGLYFIANRKIIPIFAMGLGVILGLFIPVLGLGWTRNLELLQDWYTFIIKSFQDHSVVRPWANNQTISAAIAKLFVPFSDEKQARYGLPLLFKSAFPPKEIVVLLINGIKVANLALTLGGLLFAGLYAKLRWKPGNTNLTSFNGILWLQAAILLSLLTSGVSWYHAYAMLFIPVFFRIRHLEERALNTTEIVSFGILIFFGLIQFLFPTFLKDLLALYSLFVWLCIYIYIDSIRLSWKGPNGI